MPEIVPAEFPKLAVPLASDLNVKKPPVINVAPVPTVTEPEELPPVIFKALPKVVVPLPVMVKFLSTLVVPGVVWSK